MAAYFIQYTYITHNGYRLNDDCIISYEKFEKVNDQSFYNKFIEKVKQKHYDVEPTIETIIKL